MTKFNFVIDYNAKGKNYREEIHSGTVIAKNLFEARQKVRKYLAVAVCKL
jgi:hypothetical protein